MSNDFNAIKTEIDTNPLSRAAYAGTDQAVADDLNTVYRDGAAAAGALFVYLAQEKARETVGEGTASHIYGRLRRAADGVIGTDIFVTGGKTLSYNRKDACRTLLHMADADRLGSVAEVLTKARIADILDEVIAAGVMKPGDKTAILAFSQNKQSRAAELGLSFVRAKHVEIARAI